MIEVRESRLHPGQWYIVFVKGSQETFLGRSSPNKNEVILEAKMIRLACIEGLKVEMSK